MSSTLALWRSLAVLARASSRSDKAVQAQSISGRIAMLGLYVRQGASWFADLRSELLSFPAGTIRSTRSAWSGNCSTGSAPGRKTDHSHGAGVRFLMALISQRKGKYQLRQP
jgi:hypothetical protein